MLILGLETSCDDTGAGLVEGGRLLAHVVASQDVHLEYGGVVPELASRAHITLLPRMVTSVLEKAGRRLEDVGAVAATIGPGLVGSLLVGLEFAKGFAQARGIPFYGVNHVEAHLYSPGLEHDLPFPFLGMVASGGHTEIYHVRAPGAATRLGSTRDDAAGEAFDKVGKLLGLPYPGGPHVDRLAREGNASAFAFPVARLGNDNLDVSFSGLKTAVKLAIEREPKPLSDARARDFAAATERAVVTALTDRLALALDRHPSRAIGVAGGCACNTLIRLEAEKLGRARGIPALFPSPALCRDNGAMIAYAGWLATRPGAPDAADRGTVTPLTATAIPNLDAFPVG